MLQFKLNDPTKMIYHNEPIIRENKIVGYLTSGNYGHTLGGCVGLGYVDCKDLPNEEILSFEYKVDVAGEIVPAKTSLRSMYDPRSEELECDMNTDLPNKGAKKDLEEEVPDKL